MKRWMISGVLITLLLPVAFALQTGIIFNGDLEGDNNSYIGFVARSQFGLGGLEIAVMPKVGPEVDFTSYRFIVSPSIGWGTPELRIFAGITPHIEINDGKFEFAPTKWGIGAGSTFAVARNVIGFFEFFAVFDLSGNNVTAGFAENTILSIGITYNFDVGF
ncbi:MAG TPA: hypothetical protein P5107_04960 [Thermotogota bacterium]|nr:hypothetical protein [Thermotogota bacterium]HRW34385.1 hypothetical protein [Thermotogota bacterium]